MSAVGIQTDAFTSVLTLQLQEKTKLMQAVTQASYVGRNIQAVKYLEPVAVEEVVTRGEARSTKEVTITSRTLSPRIFQCDVFVDTLDRMRTQVENVDSALVEACITGMHQKANTVIMEAMLGSTKETQGAPGTESLVALPSSQIIPITEGGNTANVPLNMVKVEAGCEQLKAGFIDFDTEEIFMISNSYQARQLMRDSSSNEGLYMAGYTAGRPILPKQLTLIEMESTPKTAAGKDQVILFSKKHVQWGSFSETNGGSPFTVLPRPHDGNFKSAPHTLQVLMYGNAIRLHNSGVVSILCEPKP